MNLSTIKKQKVEIETLKKLKLKKEKKTNKQTKKTAVHKPYTKCEIKSVDVLH